MNFLKNVVNTFHRKEEGQGVYIGGGTLLVIVVVILLILLL
jgi:hypothetical protein